MSDSESSDVSPVGDSDTLTVDVANSPSGSSAENGDAELRKSSRSKKLALKAKENRVIELTQNLLTNIDKQLAQNEEFLEKADELSMSDIDSYLLELNQNMQTMTGTHNEIKQLEENKITPSTQTLFDQLLNDAELVHSYYDQRKEKKLCDEEEADLREAERAVDEAKRKLEEDMRQLEERMLARNRRLQPRITQIAAHDAKRALVQSTAQLNEVQETPATVPVSSQLTSSHSITQPQPQVIAQQQLPVIAQEQPQVIAQQQLPVIAQEQPQVIARQQLPVLAQEQPPVIDIRSLSSSEPTAQPYQNIPNTTTPQMSTQSYQGPAPLAYNQTPADIAQAVTEHMHISLVAPPEPSIFDGDPLQYADWRVSFDSLIDARRGSPMEKLHRLKKYVSGEAHDAISGYFRLQTSDAYRDALSTLQEEFGRDDLVENSFRDKLEGWPKIINKDQAALKRYSYFLKQCLAAQAAIPNLRVLDDKRENRKFIKTLPGWLVNRWTYYVTDQEEKKGFPPFSKYVQFIAHEARVSTNNLRETDDTKTNFKPRRDTNDLRPTPKPQYSREKVVRNFNTSTSKVAKCLYCQKGIHATTECRSLEAKGEEEKEQFIKEGRLCYKCLKTGHRSKECADKATCNKCKKQHPTVLHRDQWVPHKNPNDQLKPTTTPAARQKDEVNKDQKTVNVHAIKHDNTSDLLCMVLPVYISSNGNEELVYALLDTGSDATFITTELAKRLKPTCSQERIALATLNGKTTKETNKYEVSIRGFGMSHNQQIAVKAYEQDKIPCSRNQIPNSDHAKDLHHLQGISKKLAPKMDIPVGILIGVDCSQALAPQETILGKDGNPFAIRTQLGWTLCGQLHPMQHKAAHCTKVVCDGIDRSEDNDHTKLSQNDLKFLNILEDGFIQQEDGSYSLPLPFKCDPKLPNNRVQAEKRFGQLLQRLRRDDAYKEEYFKFIQDMLESGHAEKVSTYDRADGRVWYIPHFGVLHPKKNKLRVVFDGSAKFGNCSLNAMLLPGPDHINNLVGILLRFRQERIALSCDIQKMFLNFKVTDKHRDYLRFLWTDDDMKEVNEYRMAVHLFGATSSPGVATFALRKIATKYKEQKPLASKFIVKDFYVDDGITSVKTSEEASQLAKDAIEICASANLRLHKFVSNDREVLTSIPTSEIGKDPGLDLFSGKLPTERTLGLEWCVENDTIEFRNDLKEKPVTRRGILSVVSQIYDPLGLLSPFILKGKIIMQKVCQGGSGWDEEVSPEVKKDWTKWTKELEQLQDVKVERCVTPKDFGPIARTEIHNFSDASMDGYGACSYLRLTNRKNQVHVALLIAKSRVAPLKIRTVPRLELQSAVEAVRLSSLLQNELDIAVDSEYFWSDSRVALAYIKNSDTRFHMFVANRVQGILDHTEPAQWRHIPGKINPADIVSRGATIEELIKSEWHAGPQFLREPNGIQEYLKDDSNAESIDKDDPEVKRIHLISISSNPPSITERFSRYSSWKSLVNSMALLKQMMRNRKWKRDPLTTEELTNAECFIVKMVQRAHFSADIKGIQSSQTVPRSSPLSKLNPYLDAHTQLRVGGRLKRAEFGQEERCPVIIPKHTHVARLITRHFHQKIHHLGQRSTLASVRESGYWVVSGTTMAKSEVANCITCAKLRGPPETQQMGDLPTERLTKAPPFSHVGMDVFGPYVVKDRRTVLKRYGLLFTCLYSRAVHIEMLDDLSTSSFINALRCLTALRGHVTTLYSDNGTNFVGARNLFEKEIEAMSDPKLKRFLLDNRTEFKMNTPYASHQGGVWERIIRSARAVLNGMATKYKERLESQTLRTAFYEVSNVLNSRPLTASNIGDPDEQVITPNHLLTNKIGPTPAPPPGEYSSEEVYGKAQWRKAQQLAEEFYKKWKSEYLANITQRQKWMRSKRDLKVCDVVLLIDDNTPRNIWRIGIVEAVHHGDDGHVRNLTLRLGNSHLNSRGKQMTPPTILERPIQKVVRLHTD